MQEFEPGKELANALRDSVSKDIQGIFHHHVKENAYVPQKTKCPSLGGILIPAHNIEFFTEDGKLRARITDYSKQTYELKVSCKYLRDIFEKDKDVTGLNNAVYNSQYAHCRIGLARNPDSGKSLLFDVKRAIFVLIWQRFLLLVLAVKARRRLWVY